MRWICALAVCACGGNGPAADDGGDGPQTVSASGLDSSSDADSDAEADSGDGPGSESGSSSESDADADAGSDSGADTGGNGDGDGISRHYPGDVGIDAHPSVLLFENFEDPDVATMAAEWANATLPEAMAMDADVPAGAVVGSQSLRMSVDTGSGVTLYTNLPDQHGEVYVRYYAKYNDQSQYAHTGMWIGGYNPATPWPQGNAGLLPSGSDFFHNTFEPAGGDGPLSFDHYTYWPGMQCLQAPTQCWGNQMLGPAQPNLPADAWVCLELMLGVNAPGESDGSFAIWMEDELVQRVEPGTLLSSNGVGGWEPDDGGQPFPGYNWRSAGDFGVNFIWLNFYTGGPASIGWDQVVVATERIGCMTPAP